MYHRKAYVGNKMVWAPAISSYFLQFIRGIIIRSAGITSFVGDARVYSILSLRDGAKTLSGSIVEATLV